MGDSSSKSNLRPESDLATGSAKADDKAQLRKSFRKRVSAQLSSKPIKIDWKTIVGNAEKIIQPGQNWASYCAMAEEFDPLPLTNSMGSVNWIFPRIDGDDLRFYHTFCEDDFEVEPRFGVKQPIAQLENLTDLEHIDGFLVPGVAFDQHGGRLGRGKGFYDRTLQKCGRAIKVGVAYQTQISESPLPTEVHDQYMDYLMTEEKIVKVVQK